MGPGVWETENYFIHLKIFRFRTPMHLAAEKGHTSTVEFLAGGLRLI